MKFILGFENKVQMKILCDKIIIIEPKIIKDENKANLESC